MKGINVFLGGLAVGAIAGLLLAPEKGSDLRDRIKSLLKKSGLIPANEIDILIEEITSEGSQAGFGRAVRKADDDEADA